VIEHAFELVHLLGMIPDEALQLARQARQLFAGLRPRPARFGRLKQHSDAFDQ